MNGYRLFKRVAGKTLVISRTLGIEGRKLLTPDDEFDPVKELNEQFDGHLNNIEQLRLELDELVEKHPELAASLPDLPLKLFSGKSSPRSDVKAVFFCHRVPRPDPSLIDTESGKPRWSESAGFTVWTCCDPDGKTIASEPGAIADLIRSTPATPRKCAMDKTVLSELRAKVESHLKNTHLKQMQAPVGVRPLLKCWMEVI